ncbi:hypothetical protein P2H44_11965 [Albimonas sp. CAU 1670]|uniref:hypothetical protein n=1 Tax=Albimonas sp. CAU 1670 TaxID=3032599 RepID=UPI0023DC1ABD|nr:hypothetical protein [Albimonas sp. CAU 1670]MDF2233269.1 hypothetical protein [Albimonas sp. CAU 1670]
MPLQTAPETLLAIPGGRALLDWFGHAPRFHDAEILSFDLVGGGAATLRLHAWTLLRETDAQGYYLTERHAVVTLTLRGIERLECRDLDAVPAIVFDLAILPDPRGFEVEWTSSVGLQGALLAREIEIGLTPGRPA